MSTTALVAAYFLTGLPITTYRHLLYVKHICQDGTYSVLDLVIAVCLFPVMLLLWPALELAALIKPAR